MTVLQSGHMGHKSATASAISQQIQGFKNTPIPLCLVISKLSRVTTTLYFPFEKFIHVRVVTWVFVQLFPDDTNLVITCFGVTHDLRLLAAGTRDG